MTSKYFKKAVENTPNHIKIFASKSLDIVDRIHFILEQKGMTQKVFAKLLGKQESEVSKILTGGHNLTLKTISKIEDALNESLILIPRNTIQVEEVEITKIDDPVSESQSGSIISLTPQHLLSMLGGKKVQLSSNKMENKEDENMIQKQNETTKKNR